MNPLNSIGPLRTVETFRTQARQIIGEESPEKVELGALILWEKAVAATPLAEAKAATLKPLAGAMTGYLSSLGACLGNYSGALGPATLEAAKAWRPDLLLHLQESNNFQYMDAKLSHKDLLDLGQKLEGGPRYCAGVPCSGTWNEGEQKSITTALDKLKRISPTLYPKLKGIVVQTWVGSENPEFLLGPGANGTFNCNSPGHVRVQRGVISQPDVLEHVLYHEFGHVVDDTGSHGFRSNLSGPFQGRSEKRNCVSEYATTSSSEDFAETFGFCIQHHDKITKHPDIYFHGLGSLSEKFRYVFEKTLGEKVPPPSPAWQQLKADMATGNTPFGWKNAAGEVQQGNAELRGALRGIALKWDLDKPDENLKWASQNRNRAMQEFLSHRLLGGKETTVPPLPTIAQISDQLAEYATVSEQDKGTRERLKEIEAQCQDYVKRCVPVEEVPPEVSAKTGLLFGQVALPLRERIEDLDSLAPPQWAEHILNKVDDAVLKERLAACANPREHRQVAQARCDELMELFSVLSERAKGTPQASDVVREQSEEASTRTYRLGSDLRQMFEACGRHLEKHLTPHLKEELLPVFRSLQPSG